MRLRTAEIDRYGPLVDCRPACLEGLTVLSGPNEAGKTLYLEALLQLLDPAVVDVMSPPPRVSQPPTGRVVVELGDEAYDCDGSTTLSEISAIDPPHLESVFVVRDNDLRLPADRAYYTSLIEKLGDIHTTEIGAIQSELKDRGRLTDQRLNISSDRSHHGASDVRDEAEKLAEDVRDYVERIEEESLDDLVARRLQVKRRLRETREALAEQRQAQRLAEHEHLTGQLREFRAASERLEELEAFDPDALETLRSLQQSLESDRDSLDETTGAIDEQEAEIEDVEGALERHREAVASLEQRKPAVDESRSALETYRQREDEATGAERRLSVARTVALAGIVGAGGAGVAGAVTGSTPAIGLGVGLLLVAIIAGVLYRGANHRLSAIDAARRSVMRTARDAGIDVENVADVAPAIESFERDLERAKERLTRTQQRLEDAEDRLGDLESERASLEADIRETQADIDGRLEEAAVESIEAFKARVDTRQELVPEAQSARQSLVDRFGEPEADDQAEAATTWERELDRLVSDVDADAVDAETFDEAELEELEATVRDLESDLESLEEELDNHDETLDEFDRRARRIDSQPFIDRDLELGARTRDGLEALATDLDRLVETIERDAELSRKALEVFDRIQEEEEEKLTELFDPEGPASATFERLTGGRYTEVAYDAERHDLVVERRDGRTFDPSVLSHGTRDQLYFATRVSLALQLLGNEPGFLLLDDPFLAADHDRLRQGFESLLQLADDGWQIVYFTAKREVSEGMVDAFDVSREELAPIPLGG